MSVVHGRILPVTSHVAVPAFTNTGLCPQSRHLWVYSRLAAPPLLPDTKTASGTITEGKGSRLAAVLIWTTGYLTLGNMPCQSESLLARGRPSCSHRLHHALQTFTVEHVAGCSSSTDCQRCPYWTPTVEDTSIATAMAVVMRWKLSTAVAMLAAMTITTLAHGTCTRSTIIRQTVTWIWIWIWIR